MLKLNMTVFLCMSKIIHLYDDVIVGDVTVMVVKYTNYYEYLYYHKRSFIPIFGI